MLPGARFHRSTMGLAKLAIARHRIAKPAGDLGQDFVQHRVATVRTRLLDQGLHLREGALSLRGPTGPLGPHEGPGPRQECVHLEEATPAGPRFGQRFIRQL
jgi:hypothetical protein